MTLNELIQRAVDIASKNLDTTVSRLSLETTAESLLITVFQEASAATAKIERRRSLLRRTKVLTVVNGAVVLTNDVLTEYIRDANLLDPTDKTKRYALIPWNQMVTDELDTRLGHFAVEGESTMHVVEPNTAYDPASGPSETLLLTIPCSVAVPILATDPIVAIDEIVDDFIGALAHALQSKA